MFIRNIPSLGPKDEWNIASLAYGHILRRPRALSPLPPHWMVSSVGTWEAANAQPILASHMHSCFLQPETEWFPAMLTGKNSWGNVSCRGLSPATHPSQYQYSPLFLLSHVFRPDKKSPPPLLR